MRGLFILRLLVIGFVAVSGIARADVSYPWPVFTTVVESVAQS